MNVIFPFTSSGLGGSHMSTLALAEALAEEGEVDCTVVAPDVSAVAREAGRRGLAVISSGEPPLAYNQLDLSEIERFAHRALLWRERRPGSIVHVNDFRTLLAWSVPAKTRRTPLVYHHRGLHKLDLMKRAVVSSADHVITISDACTENVRFVPSARRTQIINPIAIASLPDAAAERAAFRRRLGIPEDASVVGFMANFWSRKRPLLFMEAAAQVAARDRLVWFVLFGGGADHSADELRERASSLGVGDRVRFPGFQPDPARNFAGIDLLAAPALDEPFGRTLVEAMLCGSIYVAAAGAGHSEIHRRWGGGALLPPDAGAQEWALALENALRRPDDLKLSAEGLETLKQDVAPARHAAAVTAVYRGLLS